jgi:hypothetical protein
VSPTDPNPFGQPRHRGGRLRRLLAGAPRAEDPAELRLLAGTANELEAEMICGRLADAGIPAIARSTGPSVAFQGGLEAAGARQVYVRAGDLHRAEQLLAEDLPTDDELAELSQRSFDELTGRPADEPT